ncbi:MAG: hypothetical protein M1825_005296 [Sarcosagium campestre]|nr:MAG: hypothetical protein M1825_005296 [Sarcosagium campestre]
MAGSVRQVISRPMSVQEITEKAEDFDYNPSIPLRYWLRTADTLRQEAEIYEREGNTQQAYLLLFRHAKLVLDHLVSHPDAKQQTGRQNLQTTKKGVPKILARLDSLKPKVTLRHERYEKAIRLREAQKTLQGSSGLDNRATELAANGRLPYSRKDSIDNVSQATPVAAGDNRDLAVKLAHSEIKRRELARKATRQAGISAAEEQERRGAGMWGNWEEALAQDGQPSKESDLQRKMREARRLVETAASVDDRQRRKLEQSAARRHLEASRASTDFVYPTIPKREQDYEIPSPGTVEHPPSSRTRDSSFLDSEARPAIPTKVDFYLSSAPAPIQRDDVSPPPLPIKETLSETPSRSTTASPSPSPSPSSSLQQAEPNPATLTFKPSAYLENGTPLRTIFLPPDLRTTFLGVAATNTRAKLETCGILCGTLISNALFISRLVIPEQNNTSDTCEMINENALFDYCDSEELMVLGWIHTHPTQTCFMSSRDLHTHSAYQAMMPESIAIVCAPSKDPS